ncbi:MAG TPA: helix-turn-helix transcriptional regulator [Nostocaceae cyanobacterium]|nr:helix-turn-helix transcriptional regulator [Nostocaceae cyanobacterium]
MGNTNNAIKIIDKITNSDPELEAMIGEESINIEVAELIYTARTQAGLTQQQLAELMGTTQTVIEQLEDADYEGQSLLMLQKIARVLNQRVVINLKPLQQQQTA